MSAQRPRRIRLRRRPRRPAAAQNLSYIYHPRTYYPTDDAIYSTIMSMVAPELGHGSGSSLPLPVLLVAGTCTAVATVVSAMSILMHLKNYRKPHLQRYVRQSRPASCLLDSRSYHPAAKSYESCSWSRSTQSRPSYHYSRSRPPSLSMLYETYTRCVPFRCRPSDWALTRVDCSVGIRHLLFLRPSHRLSRRRTVAAHSLARTAAKIPRVPWKLGLEGGGC